MISLHTQVLGAYFMLGDWVSDLCSKSNTEIGPNERLDRETG